MDDSGTLFPNIKHLLMIKKILNLPLIIFSLLLILLLSSYFGVYNLNTSIANNDTHLKTISLANNISSYVKRAETHFYLYLMLDEDIDRGKFFSRMQSLDDNLSELEKISSINTDSFYKNKSIMFTAGFNMINAKDKSLQDNTVFSFESYKKEINTFYKASSDIRKDSVQIVDDITMALQNKRNTNIEMIKNVYSLFILSGIICIALLVILIKKRSYELELSKKVSEKLDKLSNTDDLTDIGNRRSFDTAFNREWQRAIRDKNSVSLMMIDIDCFKLFNDHYGHLKGDECLKIVARTLRTCMKRPADSVWRYGGEEFVAILPDTDDVISIAESCRRSIEELYIPHIKSTTSDVVTVSIGVGTLFPDKNAEAKSFIDHVDIALYEAKNTGRNKVCSYITDSICLITEKNAQDLIT
jgi:diguanylate cyclase (GGDEF)-like protein